MNETYKSSKEKTFYSTYKKNQSFGQNEGIFNEIKSDVIKNFMFAHE